MAENVAFGKKFPFEYGSVHLYDELKYLALRQKLDDVQNAKEISLEKCLSLSKSIEKTLENASINRNALFTKRSIDKFFGITSHLRKSGFFGKALAFLIEKLSFTNQYKS